MRQACDERSELQKGLCPHVGLSETASEVSDEGTGKGCESPKEVVLFALMALVALIALLIKFASFRLPRKRQVKPC